jgi:hypothetical protein
MVKKAERKRLLRRHMYRWNDNIKTDLKETQCDSVEQINMDP